ncbi:MAG: hypothetical protein ACK5OC_00690 [Pirellula sp.]
MASTNRLDGETTSMVDDAKRVYYQRMQFTEECLGYQSHNRRRV